MAIKPNTDEGTVAALNLHQIIARLTAGEHYYMLTSGTAPIVNAERCFEAASVNEARRKARAAGFSHMWLMALDGGCVELTC